MDYWNLAITPKSQMMREIASLVSKYGFQNVHESLQELMKQEYEFLSKFFAGADGKAAPAQTRLPAVPGSKKTTVTPPAHAEASSTQEVTPAPAPVTTEPVKKGKLTTVKVTKDSKTILEAQKEEAEAAAAAATPAPAPAPEQQPSNTEPQAQQIDPSKAIPKFATPQEQKAWQKEQEDAKRQELESQGVDPKSLMTKENLKRWVEEEKNSYAWVARKVGIPEHKVSAECKKLGVLSDIHKRRGAIIGAKSKAHN